jgi:hypothetical protein
LRGSQVGAQMATHDMKHQPAGGCADAASGHEGQDQVHGSIPNADNPSSFNLCSFFVRRKRKLR